jgi:hypothetical protein
MHDADAGRPGERAPVPSSFSGGCACGAVRYRCSAPPIVMLNCHCRDCQRSSGGASSAVVVVPAGAFALTKGEPRFHAVRGEGGHTAHRGFCPVCGSPLLGRTSRSNEFVALKAGSLDDPSWFHPVADLWTASAQPWACMDPGTAKVPKDFPPR